MGVMLTFYFTAIIITTQYCKAKTALQHTYKIIDEVNIDSDIAKSFLYTSRKNHRKNRSTDEKDTVNEELQETCINNRCTLEEHDNLEFWEEQFEPARTHAEEKTEEKSELVESQAEFSEVQADWNDEIRQQFYSNVMKNVFELRNQSWTKLRNNCEYDGGCNKNGTDSCVQKWNSRVCYCIEGYYGDNCEKGGTCDCKNKQLSFAEIEVDVVTEENVQVNTTLKNLNDDTVQAKTTINSEAGKHIETTKIQETTVYQNNSEILSTVNESSTRSTSTIN